MNPETYDRRNAGPDRAVPGPKRIFIFVIIIVVAAISFVVGRYTTPKPYMNPALMDNGLSNPTDHRQGIPPDSLSH